MIFIFGYGYTAKHLVSKVSDKEIFATSRSLNSSQINQKNIKIIDPLKTSNILEKYKNEITHLVISVPPDQSGDIFLKNINFNLHELINLKWIGYLSATSVYGDHDGQFVSETSRLLTKSKRGISRQLAEDLVHLVRGLHCLVEAALNSRARVGRQVHEAAAPVKKRVVCICLAQFRAPSRGSPAVDDVILQHFPAEPQLLFPTS